MWARVRTLVRDTQTAYSEREFFLLAWVKTLLATLGLGILLLLDLMVQGGLTPIDISFHMEAPSCK